MKPTIPLKYCSDRVRRSVGAAGCSGGAESIDPANIIILSICGAVAGYLWYRAMRWSFRRMKLLPRGRRRPGASRPRRDQASHSTGRLSSPRNAQPPIRTGSRSSSRRPFSRAKMLGSATSATMAREAKAPAQ